MGIVLLYYSIYMTLFSSTRQFIARNGIYIYIYIYIYTCIYIFHKIRDIPLVLALISGNCRMIIDPLENSEKKT